MAGKTTNAGFLFNEFTGTGREFVNLQNVPSVTTLFIDISGSASLNIELRDSTKTDFIPVRTVTENSIIRIAINASQLAVNIVSNSGTVTVTYRINVTENFPNTAIESFTGGDIEPGTINANVTIAADSGSIGVRKKLAQVQVAATPTTIYTVPADTQTVIKTINIVNTDASNPHTITLWHDGSGNVNMILPPVVILAGGFAVFEGEYSMETSDTLVADADAGTVLTITVTGLQEAV